jgi:hypothetical protein
MSFLEQLKSLIHIDISKLESLHFNWLSGNKINITVNKIDNHVVNLQKPEDRQLVENLMKQSIEDYGVLIEDKAEAVIEGIKESDETPENKALLDFFKGKIKQSDLEILRAAIYIRTAYLRGSKVKDSLDRLAVSYGSRGRNISKLCSAGYFESIIKPMYEEMERQEEDDKQALSRRFLERFDVIVHDSPFAIFVNENMTETSLEEMVIRKVRLNRQYGIREMNIHGIGNANVRLIESVLSSDEVKGELLDIPEIDKRLNVIVVKVKF